MKKLTISLFVACTSVYALAAPDEFVVQEMARQTKLSVDDIKKNYDACDSGVTWPMKICGSYRWMVEDVRLNKIYKRTLTKARELGYESSLQTAQRAWLTYRDAACNYEGAAGAGDGTAAGLYVLSCKLDLTKQRADRLEEGLRE
ncbi:MAG TPA: lysozyme inhibitor LprI family protein [Burkholderiaceae bacterium]|nr:lysozyme inhibitor LprI family protein [Burkholderiaceae bacterium]